MNLPELPWIKNRGYIPNIIDGKTIVDLQLTDSTEIFKVEAKTVDWKPANLLLWRLNKDHVKAGHRAHVATICLRRQVHNSPEARLHFGIIEVAIHDLTANGINALERRSAVSFLNSDSQIFHSIGLNPKWVRQIINEVGLSLDTADYSYKAQLPPAPKLPVLSKIRLI